MKPEGVKCPDCDDDGHCWCIAAHQSYNVGLEKGASSRQAEIDKLRVSLKIHSKRIGELVDEKRGERKRAEAAEAERDSLRLSVGELCKLEADAKRQAFAAEAKLEQAL